MITIVKITNPFEPFKDTEVTTCAAGCSVLQILGGGISWNGFDRPTICLVNGSPLLLSEYGNAVPDGAVVTFVVLAGNPVSIIIAIIITIISVAIALALTPQPPNIGDTPEPDSVFTLRGQQNQAKIGQCIPSHFGDVRSFPDYAARPYNQYEGNQQYQYSLYCLGHGTYEVSEMRFDDTPIETFEDVETQLALPGQDITLFPDAVVTSSEVGSIELFGPNQAEHTGHAGPFASNDIGTLCNKIQVDVVLPRGLYESNNSGGLSEATASATFEYRAVGATAWLPLGTFNQTLATVTPQRYTITKDLTPGRWEVRAIRTNDKNESHRVGDSIIWEGMRAFLPDVKEYGQVTMLAVRARASNNLNDRSRNSFNVRQKRKLPVYDVEAGEWLPVQLSRSPYWATVEIFKSTYGGRLADMFLDLEAISAAATAAELRNDNFDFSYNQRTNVWDAARLALSVDKANPMLNGSQVTVTRDEVQALAKAIFTPSNMIAGSFNWEISLWSLGEHDGLLIEYLDEETWLPEVITCLIGDDQGDNLKDVKINGITNRDKAYQMGMFMRAKEVFRRQRVTFETGMEGHIPAFNSMVAITYDRPRWGQSGLVLSSVGNVLTLSEYCNFTPFAEHKIQFRKRDGSASPMLDVVIQDAPSRTIEVVGTIEEDFARPSNEERVFYQFGVADLVARNCKISMLRPTQEQTVSVEAIIDDPRVYDYDEVEAPAKTSWLNPPAIPIAPTINNLTVSPISGTLTSVLASWTPAPGSVQYVIETSTDGASYGVVATTLSSTFTLVVAPGPFWVRVAAIGSAQGAYSVWSGEVGVATVPAEAPEEVTAATPFVGASVTIQWPASLYATSYVVEVLDNGDDSVLRIQEVTTLSYSYGLDQAFPDFGGVPERAIKFRVYGKNSFDMSTEYAELVLTNPAPAVPSSIAAVEESDDVDNWYVRVSWNYIYENDILEYRLWADDTDGFTPSDVNLISGGAIFRTALITVSKAGGPVTYYYRVACLDKWGVDYTTSAQFSIALS